jgi:hypothetical protein
MSSVAALSRNASPHVPHTSTGTPLITATDAPTTKGMVATVSARSGRAFFPLFQSSSLREIPAQLRAAAWMAMAEDARASGVAMA